MNKKVAKEICKKINSLMDDAEEQSTITREGQQARQLYLERAQGLRDALDIAGVQYTTDNWCKCFVD